MGFAYLRGGFFGFVCSLKTTWNRKIEGLENTVLTMVLAHACLSVGTMFAISTSNIN